MQSHEKRADDEMFCRIKDDPLHSNFIKCSLRIEIESIIMKESGSLANADKSKCSAELFTLLKRRCGRSAQWSELSASDNRFLRKEERKG